MSALGRPEEIVLLALFGAAGPAEAAARAFLHSGLEADRVATLARDTRGTAMAAVPRAAVFRLPGIGRVVARGALAGALDAGPIAGLSRLATALRRLGLSVADAPRLERALRLGRVLVLAAVPLSEARRWARLLEHAGAVSLAARPRLDVWPDLSGPGRRRRGPLRPSAAAG